MAGIYLHSVPVNVWQRQAGTWLAYFFNASVINDVSKSDGTRTINFDFGYGKDVQHYSPRINDIMVPIANMAGIDGEPFQFYGTRSNQPYYWDGINDDWMTRPGIMFLTAFNESTLQFSDFFSVPEYDLIPAGELNLQRAVQLVAANVWNRLIGGHPVLKPTTADNVLGTQVTDIVLNNDSPTAVKLNDVARQLAAARDWRAIGGTVYFPPETSGGQYSKISWLGTQELDVVAFDLRQEDILQLEVRSRESSDAPNLVISYDKQFHQMPVWMDAGRNIQWGTPAAGSTWSWRATYQEVDDATNKGQTGDKAIQYLMSSASENLSDISIVLDMSSRYNVVYNTETQASWSLPVPGVPVHIFGYLPDSDIVAPVREYDFAAGKLLIATNDDITLGKGV